MTINPLIAQAALPGEGMPREHKVLRLISEKSHEILQGCLSVTVNLTMYNEERIVGVW